MNSRAKMEESPEQKHKFIIDCLKNVKSPWGLKKDADIPFPGFGDDFTAIVNLNDQLQNNIKGTIFYRYRNRLEDDSSCDDRMHFEFSTKKVDYSDLTVFGFKHYISCFKPYYAAIFNEKIIFEDFEKTRFKNFRKDIVRFCPIFFLDEQLSFKALGLSLVEVKYRLEKIVEKVELFNNGLIAIYSSKPLDLKESNDANKSIENALIHNQFT